MAKPTRTYFETLTQYVEGVLESVSVKRLDVTADRVLWEMQGMLGQYHIHLKEIHTQSGRMYAYYEIHNNDVVVGFDNYPDRQVLSQRYGNALKEHLDELIPHKHGFRKTTVELTQEISVKEFLTYLQDRGAMDVSANRRRDLL